MKYQEKYIGSKRECYEGLKDIFAKLIKGILEIEGEAVDIPNDKELEYKVKYDNNEVDGQLAIKVTWMNIDEPEEEEEFELEI